MTLFVWVCAFVALGPVYDPQYGETATEDAIRTLPAARQLGDMADMWFLPPVNTQVSGGGIETFDDTRLSSHGRSVYLLRIARGQLDMTDVARPGEALIDFSPFFISSVHHASLWTARPGFQLRPISLGREKRAGAALQLGRGKVLGGPPFFPSGVFDRDPSFAFGSPKRRRALVGADEWAARIVGPVAAGRLALAAERITHQHRYLTLRAPENASRLTVTAHVAQRLGRWRLEAEGAYQGRHREYAGAESRLPQRATRREGAHAGLFRIEAEGPAVRDTKLSLGLLLGAKKQSERGSPDAITPLDLEAQGLYLSLPRRPEHLTRQQLHAFFRWDGALGPLSRWQLRSDLTTGAYQRQVTLGRTTTRETYRGKTATVSLWQQGAPQGGLLLEARTDLELSFRLGEGRVSTFAGIDWARAYVVGQQVGFLSPAGGGSYRRRFWGHEFFLLARHDPEFLTAKVTDFLDRGGPSASVYLAQDGQENALLLRNETGGRVHEIDTRLRRPSASAFAFGTRSPFWGPFEFSWAGIGRFVESRFTVTEAPSEAAVEHVLDDPGGDGRGEDFHLEGGGQRLVDNNPSLTMTRARHYALTHDHKLARYLGVELNLSSLPGRKWFINVGGAAYLSSGQAPFGNFAGRNDPGVIDESSAGRNNRLQAYGRYDHDRSYTLKVLAGYLFSERLSLTTAARYRDGQPFARLVVDPNLDAGPAALMAIRRGRARHTFQMTWDIRLSAIVVSTSFTKATFVLDIFNVLGSATEILEDNRTGPTFRQSLEAVPERSLFAMLRFDSVI